MTSSIPPRKINTDLINFKILSATYGPREGRRLLNGESSTVKQNRIPYERDVLPFLMSLLSRAFTEINSCNDDESDMQRVENLKQNSGVHNSLSNAQHFQMSKAKNSITILSGVKSMNAIFGDPCPGTK